MPAMLLHCSKSGEELQRGAGEATIVLVDCRSLHEMASLADGEMRGVKDA